MSLPRSSYYYQPKRQEIPAPTLVARIEAIAEEFSRYGYRRITEQLHREGLRINHKKVQRILRERGLTRKPKRR